MLGGIYGDKVGSIYEFAQLKEIKSINPDKLITSESFYSDDTIEIIAVLDAIINKKHFDENLREYILKYEDYRPNYKPYFKTSFSPETIKWAKGIGKNNSIGNGAMMRISPIGFLFDSEQDVEENSRLATIPTHNSKEAIECATIIAKLIYYFRNGISKYDAYRLLSLNPKYIPFTKFNMTCYETLNNCLYAIYIAKSFEEALRVTLLMGGDTDTNCCIVGSVCEALYGMNETQKAESYANLPNEFVKVLKRVY